MNLILCFRNLFGGGKAELKYSDPDNILETGIDIDVQPPGKAVQNITLFSGGEKALIAISCLFAILRVRPVPMCILDEVEAALDVANVDVLPIFKRVFSSRHNLLLSLIVREQWKNVICYMELLCNKKV